MALRKGETLPLLELSEAGGETVRTWDYKGKRSLVLFLSHPPGCHACEAEAAELAEVYRDLTGAGAEVLAVLPASQEEAVQWKERQGLPFPVLVNEEGETDEAAIAVTDRFGEVFGFAGGKEEHPRMGVGEIFAWLDFISVQCPE
jgi:peroxiredoxin